MSMLFYYFNFLIIILLPYLHNHTHDCIPSGVYLLVFRNGETATFKAQLLFILINYKKWKTKIKVYSFLQFSYKNDRYARVVRYFKSPTPLVPWRSIFKFTTGPELVTDVLSHAPMFYRYSSYSLRILSNRFQ